MLKSDMRCKNKRNQPTMITCSTCFCTVWCLIFYLSSHVSLLSWSMCVVIQWAGPERARGSSWPTFSRWNNVHSKINVRLHWPEKNCWKTKCPDGDIVMSVTPDTAQKQGGTLSSRFLCLSRGPLPRPSRRRLPGTVHCSGRSEQGQRLSQILSLLVTTILKCIWTHFT